MVGLTGSYRYIDQQSVWYVPIHTNIPTHGMMGHTDKPICTTHTGPLSDQYIPPVPGNMPRHNKP